MRRTRRPLIALVALLAALAVGYAVQAVRGHSTSSSTSTSASTSAAHEVALSTLPAQAAQTVALIKKGGPYPYSQDGVVFDNNEHRLPSEPRGYYHEYTVVTPGASTRATRRIITGRAGEFYYTGDHYESFVRVDVNR